MSFMTSRATVTAHSLKRLPIGLTARRLSVVIPIAQGGIMISHRQDSQRRTARINRNTASLDMPRNRPPAISLERSCSESVVTTDFGTGSPCVRKAFANHDAAWLSGHG